MLSVRLRQRAVPVAGPGDGQRKAIGALACRESFCTASRCGGRKAARFWWRPLVFRGPCHGLTGANQQAGWSYRIRLLGNLTLSHAGGHCLPATLRRGFPKASSVLTSMGVAS